MVSSARPEEMEFPTWRRAPDDGLIAAVRQHAHTRRSSVGVCDSEVMFVASCRLIQGAIRVKVHRIDVHMRQRPVSLSFPPPFSLFLAPSHDRPCRRATVYALFARLPLIFSIFHSKERRLVPRFLKNVRDTREGSSTKTKYPEK